MYRKLHNEPVVYDGIQFASKREANRYAELKLLLRARRITDLKLQVKFNLIPKQQKEDGKWERAIDYIADFTYMQDGKMIVEDAKGYRDPNSATYAKFVMKRKLMLYIHGITVHEV